MPLEGTRARVWTSRKIACDSGPLRVLVVDDNKNAADALTMYLQQENLDVKAAYGGRAAVDRSEEWMPHLIVLDISMPEYSGFDAALCIRANSRTAHIAIVAFTALDESEVRRQLSDHEFDAYCQKGQPPTKLLDLLWKLTDCA